MGKVDQFGKPQLSERVRTKRATHRRRSVMSDGVEIVMPRRADQWEYDQWEYCPLCPCKVRIVESTSPNARPGQMAASIGHDWRCTKWCYATAIGPFQ